MSLDERAEYYYDNILYVFTIYVPVQYCLSFLAGRGFTDEV